MKIAAIVQARMGSSRLPGKVLEEIAGQPMLWHLIKRLQKSRLLEGIIIATTANEIDRPILNLAAGMGIDSFAGSETDVLDRYYQASNRYGVGVICRITADCPVIDPRIVDKAVTRFLNDKCDIVFAAHYPDGLDTEVISYTALKKAWNEARLASEREHVTPYIYKNPQIFKISEVKCIPDLSDYRWTVDRKEDLVLIREIYRYLYREGEMFYMEDILKLFKKRPFLMLINRDIARNEGYVKSLKEDRLIQ
jgi:spore coat polysaccharide biosynthesis protein SpsF (cytidylyltransferase family)